MIEDVEQVQVTVNGEDRTVPEGAGLPDLLRQLDIDPEDARGLAVAVNDTVVRREEWTEITLHAGDRIEVVTATQGG